jgi:hypothetical protein
MEKNKIIFLGVAALILTLLIFHSFSYYNSYYKIPSQGHISPFFPHPYGKLHIGDETLGQNTWFFYDENGHLVTLRMYQSGHRGIGFYTTICEYGDYAGQTWADASISFAKDAEYNCFRIHMFFGSQYASSSEWLFPSRRTVNETVFDYFLGHLEDLADNNIYFVLDGYWHQGSSSFWMAQELNGTAPSYGGLLWNSTVQDDFIWCWTEVLTRIKNRGENVWNHLVFIEPWSELFMSQSGSVTGTDLSINAQHPYRYNGTFGYGDAALKSWHNWLKKKYNNNIDSLKTVWSKGAYEAWNYSGVENNTFESLLMSFKTVKYSVRAYDFNEWFAEVVENFTRDCTTYWKTCFPDLYVAWDGWASGLTYPSISSSDIRVKPSACFKYSDVLDGHDFAGTSEDYTYFLGDNYVYRQIQLAAIARTLKKPYVTGEFGAGMSIALGYDSGQDTNNINCWKIVLNRALRHGYAGWCPFWCSYWHAWETGIYSTRVARCDARRPYMRELNLLYKAAENWIDKNEYDPIMIVTNGGAYFGTSYSETGSSITKLFDEAGYIPKYWGFSHNNETFYPETIPNDVEVVVLGELGSTGDYTKEELKIINDWLNSDGSHKLIICYPARKDLLQQSTIHFEDFVNTTLFPLSAVTYDTSYILNSNATDTYVDVDGVYVLLARSNAYHSGGYIEFPESYITGTCLINYTDTGKPMTIINNRIAWIGSVIGLQCGNPNSEAYAACRNGYLIIRKILNYWGCKPNAEIAESYRRVVVVFSKISDTYGIVPLFSLNQTYSGTINVKFNFTTMGLDRNYNYILFSQKTKNTMIKTPSELESAGIIISLEPMSRDIIVLRTNNTLCYLYSNSYVASEMIADSQSLTCELIGMPGKTDLAYFYFPFDITQRWKIGFNNGTTLDAQNYYDATNKLIKVPLNFQYPKVIIHIYNG